MLKNKTKQNLFPVLFKVGGSKNVQADKRASDIKQSQLLRKNKKEGSCNYSCEYAQRDKRISQTTIG